MAKHYRCSPNLVTHISVTSLEADLRYLIVFANHESWLPVSVIAGNDEELVFSVPDNFQNIQGFPIELIMEEK